MGMRVSPVSLHLVNEGRIEALDDSITADIATYRRMKSASQFS